MTETQRGWGAPQTSTGFKTGEYAGALVLVTALAYEASVQTTYGDKDAVLCHITVCYHPTDSAQNGSSLPNVRLFNAAIVGSLRNAVGTTVGGRITMGRGQGGNTKYTLDEVSDANSVAYLDHYWKQHCEKFGVNESTGQLSPRAEASAPSPMEQPAPPSAGPSSPPTEAGPAPTPPPPNGTPSISSLPTPPPPPVPSGEPPF